MIYGKRSKLACPSCFNGHRARNCVHFDAIILSGLQVIPRQGFKRKNNQPVVSYWALKAEIDPRFNEVCPNNIDKYQFRCFDNCCEKSPDHVFIKDESLCLALVNTVSSDKNHIEYEDIPANLFNNDKDNRTLSPLWSFEGPINEDLIPITKYSKSKYNITNKTKQKQEGAGNNDTSPPSKNGYMDLKTIVSDELLKMKNQPVYSNSLKTPLASELSHSSHEHQMQYTSNSDKKRFPTSVTSPGFDPRNAKIKVPGPSSSDPRYMSQQKIDSYLKLYIKAPKDAKKSQQILTDQNAHGFKKADIGLGYLLEKDRDRPSDEEVDESLKYIKSYNLQHGTDELVKVRGGQESVLSYYNSSSKPSTGLLNFNEYDCFGVSELDDECSSPNNSPYRTSQDNLQQLINSLSEDSE